MEKSFFTPYFELVNSQSKFHSGISKWNLIWEKNTVEFSLGKGGPGL
jgi:hypothetical protein